MMPQFKTAVRLALARPNQLVALMSRTWFKEFAQRFNFPANYTTVDLETTGISPEEHLICSIGHTRVRNHEIVETKEVYLNWPAFPGIDHDRVMQDLYNVERAMARKNKSFFHTWERLRNEGEDPVETLRYYLDMFEDMEARKEVLIAHNGWRFDCEFFQSHFHNFLRVPFSFHEDLVYDTGICEKASQLDDVDDPLPAPGETMQQWAWRIGELPRRGVYWALDKHCDETYGLFQKAGLDTSAAHAAGADSLVLHYLFQEHRRLAGLADQLDGVQDTPQIVEEDAQS